MARFAESLNPESRGLEWIFPIVCMETPDHGLPSGTGFFIGPGLALTAAHVLLDFSQRLGQEVPPTGHLSLRGELRGIQIFDEQAGVLPLRIERAWIAAPLDIAVLQVAAAAPVDLTRRCQFPLTDVRPPDVGETVFAIGFPESRWESRPDAPSVWRVRPTATEGRVVEVHYQLRDRARLPFPCFRTDAEFGPGLSGSPVMNEKGRVCGIVCSSLPATSESEDHVSYASTLWPALGTSIDGPWLRQPTGTSYPLLALTTERVFVAENIEHVSIVSRANSQTTVAMYDPRGNPMHEEVLG